MTETYRHILNAVGETSTAPSYVDDSIPEGHFIATTVHKGYITTYLLRGVEGDENAPIVGRVEVNKDMRRLTVFRGDRMTGGDYFAFDTYEDAFAKMVA